MYCGSLSVCASGVQYRNRLFELVGCNLRVCDFSVASEVKTPPSFAQNATEGWGTLNVIGAFKPFLGAYRLNRVRG
jgi:hypothetical protein